MKAIADMSIEKDYDKIMRYVQMFNSDGYSVNVIPVEQVENLGDLGAMRIKKVQLVVTDMRTD